MKFSKIILPILIALILFSCQNEEKKEKKDWSKINNQLIDVNKYLVQEDVERIESYIKRNEWNMTQTETGLWYEIYENGNGKQAEENDIATMNYSVELLDGTVCYSSDSLGTMTFKIGKGNVESGIQEGILLLKVGDKARFIIPPYLAHGLLGDDNKIPVRSIIVYNVELLSLD
ncbi:MAG: FKBP-type peptidyl-prolyl cis-trans isomerase [Bacteroidales bacterium]|nr:FKBP-type peptidyl-prolyl cis-trans isomerase [Bacteroidales bacterium]